MKKIKKIFLCLLTLLLSIISLNKVGAANKEGSIVVNNTKVLPARIYGEKITG